MKKNIFVVIFLIICVLSFVRAQDYCHFQSYTQLRYTIEDGASNSVEMRRLKFYLRNGKDFYPGWSYFITAGFYQRSSEKFILHDVRLSYQWKNVKIYFGQFIPAFSLQRFQPDWRMPVLERAQVVRYLQPNGTIGIRDLGAELEFHTKDKRLASWIGVFNGRGTKQWLLDNKSYMLIGKMQYDLLSDKDNDLILGMSYAFRKVQDLALPKVLPDTLTFTGFDRRWNMFLLFRNKIFSIQGEYIGSDLYDFSLSGYYVLSTLTLKKNQFVLFYENFCNSAIKTEDCSRLWIGHNYFLDKNYFRIANFVSFTNSEEAFKVNYMFQIQIFLAK